MINEDYMHLAEKLTEVFDRLRPDHLYLQVIGPLRGRLL